MSCNQKRFDDLSVGTKDKEVFSELKYCFQVQSYYPNPLSFPKK